MWGQVFDSRYALSLVEILHNIKDRQAAQSLQTRISLKRNALHRVEPSENQRPDPMYHKSSRRSVAPCQYFLNRAAAVSDGFFCFRCASARPKNERGLLGLRFKSSRNTFSASANWPARMSAAPRV